MLVRHLAPSAAGRPLRPDTLGAIERSAAGNPFFAELALVGERLLAALAVIDDGFASGELTSLAGVERVDAVLGDAEAAGVLESARGRYRFRHVLVRAEEGLGKGCRRRCRHAIRTRRRIRRMRCVDPEELS